MTPAEPEPTTDDDAPSPSWRRLRWLLVGLVLCRGLAAVCVLPPFEGWDEYQHVAYVEHVRATGQRAVLWETSVSPALLAGVVAFPQPDCAARDQLGVLGAVGYAEFWSRHDPLAPGTSPPRFRGGSNALYQAQHSPLYYRLAAPLYAALGGADDLRRSVGGLRLANVALTAAAVWVALGALRKVVRRERDAALIGLALAAHPLFLLNGARVANDALGVALATSAVAAGLSLLTVAAAGGRGLAWRAGVVGLLVGLAVQAKATNLGLIPFAAFCWLGSVCRLRPRPSRAALMAVLMPAGCLLVIQGEVRFNLARFGGLTSMQEAAINHHKGLGRAELLRTAATFDWPRSLTRLWTRDLFFTGGWSFQPAPRRWVRLYRDGVTAGLFGWACLGALALSRHRRAGPFTSAWVPLACVVLVASYTAALAYHMVQSKLAWGVSTTNPWYASPALPWFLALVCGGGLCWPLGRWLRPAIPLALAGAGLLCEIIAFSGLMVPLYTGGATGRLALVRLAWLQPGFLGTPTLFASLVVEVLLLATLVLTWRDAVRAEAGDEGASILKGTHMRRVRSPQDSVTSPSAPAA
jgi:hypothetical protein